MKTITILLILLSININAQTSIDLSNMTSNVTLGQNCGNNQEVTDYVTPSGLNLNGFVLRLKNANLVVTGDIEGLGNIILCGNSTICTNGTIQNNVKINGSYDYDPTDYVCNTLSNQQFEIDLDNIQDKFINLPYMKYDVTGRQIEKGITSKETILYGIQELVIMKIQGYKAFKLRIRNKLNK